jgi:putative phosphoesterase
MPLGIQKVGLISDTHGLLRESAIEALGGSDLIVHAGDVGKPEILEALKKIAPVVAVRGNVDTAVWARELPETTVAEAGPVKIPVKIFVLHDLQALDLNPAVSGFRIVVSGHSHKPGQTTRDGVLYINPGSAGPRRFKLPVCLALLDLRPNPYAVEFVTLDGSP